MINMLTLRIRPRTSTSSRRLNLTPDAKTRGVGRAISTAVAAVLLFLAATACGSGDSVETASDFTLPSAFGSSVSLSRVLSEYDSAVIVFYRGSF